MIKSLNLLVKLTGMNNPILDLPSCGLSPVIFVCLHIRSATIWGKKELEVFINMDTNKMCKPRTVELTPGESL